MNAVKKFNTCYLVPVMIIAALFMSCTAQKFSITGSWTSTSISNPSPFFKKTLPDKRKGIILFTAAPDGTFTWKHKEEKKVIEGKFTLSGDQLILEAKDEKPVKLKAAVTGEELSLVTEDRFTFAFKRKPQDH